MQTGRSLCLADCLAEQRGVPKEEVETWYDFYLKPVLGIATRRLIQKDAYRFLYEISFWLALYQPGLPSYVNCQPVLHLPVSGDLGLVRIPYPGGAPANVAAALAKLGDKVTFVTALGEDDLGKEMFDLLAGM
jgi:pfkB family carbohydrate kinase